MLCDKLTPCITMYSEYTEMSKDIDTSEKKKKKKSHVEIQRQSLSS